MLELVCPDCHTDEEIEAAIDNPPGYWPDGLWYVLQLVATQERRRGVESYWHSLLPQPGLSRPRPDRVSKRPDEAENP